MKGTRKVAQATGAIRKTPETKTPAAELGAGRGSVQSAGGGPRLNGKLRLDAAASAVKGAAATRLPGKLGIVTTASSGKAHASEPHTSQCEPVAGAPLSPAVPASGALAVSVLRLHTPPSLPVRTSSASMELCETNANSTARKLRKAAKRVQTAGGRRKRWAWDTTGL